MLNFMPKKGAMILRKVLDSAIANATQNDKVDVDTLYIKKIFIDGPFPNELCQGLKESIWNNQKNESYYCDFR